MWSFFSRDPSKDFNYEILDPVTADVEDFMIWKLHKGKKKGTSDQVSIFLLDFKSPGNETVLDLARSAIKRLKTLRHPNILTFIDSFETEKCIYLITEYVEPLQLNLKQFSLSDSKENAKQQKELFIAWGLFQVTRALSFLNNDGNLQHNSVCLGSIFVNTAGEWKLGGLEWSAPPSPDKSLPIKILPVFEKYNPPEQNDFSKLKLSTKWSSDMWGLGCLIWEVFNGTLKSPASLKSLGNIPKPLVTVYCELVGANPSSRPNPSEVLSKCQKSGGYFHNDLVDCLLFLEEIQMKEANEKARFFNNLPALLDSFPSSLSRYKILPLLINAFEFGNAGSSILNPLFKLGSLLSEEEYQKRIVPCVVKLFSSPDRATRVRLLQQLEYFGKHLLPNTVNDQIFPHIVNGFIDSNPVIREHTVKSILYLAPKLNYNNLNVEVLKHFARLQAKDEQGGIRTNTTVCLGKVASHLHPQIRQKILVSAFTRALRDPFSPARVGGILALAATQQYYPLSAVSQVVLPALCVLTSDPEREVRDHAFKVIKGFLGKLEKVSEDPSLKESMEADINASANQPSVASSWAGWAVTAVTSKFYKAPLDKVNNEGEGNAAVAINGSVVSNVAANSNCPNSETPSTSLMKEGSDASWDVSNWGDMSSATSGGTKGKNDTDEGWEVEDEEWAPFEDSKPETVHISPATPNISAHLGSASKDFVTTGNKQIKSARETMNSTKSGSNDWGTNWDAENWSSDGTGTDKDEAQRRREEKRLQRQKEIEAKRNLRQGGSQGGPLKLGAKKMGQ